MKFSAAAFTLLSLCVNGDIHNTPSLRGGGGGEGQESSSSQQPKFPALGHQQERRLVQGSYLVIFEDDVEDVEDFAVKLSNSRGKRPDYIMKNSVHGVYMSGLSDADVEFLQTAKGVAFVEQNHYLDLVLFEGMPQQEQAQVAQEVQQQDELGMTSLTSDARAEAQQNKKRRRRRKKTNKPTPPKPTPVTPNRQPVPWNIQRVNGAVTYRGSNKVWILDTGIMMDHPDLNVDRINAYNVLTGNNDANDDNGHGTQCAGIIAAIDNDFGSVGVAAGATVVPIKVWDHTGRGDMAAVVVGVDYVASKAKRGDVVNMSLGGPTNIALDRAVIALAAKGVIVTIAAGNDYEDAQNVSPAHVVATNVYTISSMNSSGRFSGKSNYGSVVDYCCPGEGIQSTHINGGLTDREDLVGTSYAAPHAAGIFLLGHATTDGVVAYDPDGNNDPCLVNGQ